MDTYHGGESELATEYCSEPALPRSRCLSGWFYGCVPYATYRHTTRAWLWSICVLCLPPLLPALLPPRLRLRNVSFSD